MVKNDNSYAKLLTITTSILTGAAAISGIIISSSGVSADSATASVTVGSACTMTATVNTAHTAEVPAGSSQTGIGSTTLNTICNDAGGFAIYAVGFTNDEYGNNKMSNGTAEFNTGTGSSASNWNMSLSQVTTGTYATTIDGGFGSYSAIPATYTKVAHRDSVTDAVGGSSATGSSIALTYGAYISTTQATGDYVGKVKFTLVHPTDADAPLLPQVATSGCINYFANASTAIGTMGCQSISSSATTATLLASNFSRAGYGFAGWSDAYDYATNPNAHFYGPNEDITFTAGQYTGANDGLALYAVWVKSAGSIQSWFGCSSLASGAVTALTDQRDNETYAVAKLADGNCWMIENLRLESTASHNSDGMLAQGYGISATYGNFSGLADAETADKFFLTYSANSLYSNDGSNDTINIGSSYAAYRMPRYNNVNTPTTASDRPQNPTTNSATNSTSNAGMYSYGNYYTWHAAIAALNPNNTDNQSTTGTSLCPTGWHLPKGGDKSNEANNEFWSLVVTGINNGTNPANYESSIQPYYTGTPEGSDASKAIRAYPNNFVYSGYVDRESGSVLNRGIYGDYYSSTARSIDSAYLLFLGSSSVIPGSVGDAKYFGRTIRCLVYGAPEGLSVVSSLARSF